MLNSWCTGCRHPRQHEIDRAPLAQREYLLARRGRQPARFSTSGPANKNFKLEKTIAGVFRATG